MNSSVSVKVEPAGDMQSFAGIYPKMLPKIIKQPNIARPKKDAQKRLAAGKKHQCQNNPSLIAVRFPLGFSFCDWDISCEYCKFIPCLWPINIHNSHYIMSFTEKDKANSELLEENEERELLSKIRTGDLGAREQVILANVGLVRKWAHHYKYFGVPLEDLIQEGYLGLIRAIDRFASQGTARLSTYATWWIRHYIRQAIARQSCPFYVPTPILTSFSRLRDIATQLKMHLDREPCYEEIAKAMGCSVTHVQTLNHVCGVTISPQNHQCDGREEFFCEQVADENQLSPSEHLVRKTLPHDIEHWFRALTEREVKVLRMYYGLNGQAPLSFKEIGVDLSLNRERVRQIARDALAKIRKLVHLPQ
jgi:RNA polymerase primary sigma factor